jgi:hypothetical protein
VNSCVQENLLPAPYPQPHQSTPPPPITYLKYFTVVIQLQRCLPSCLFPYEFHTKTQYDFPFYPTHATFPAQPILLDLTIRTIGHYSSRSHTLYNFPAYSKTAAITDVTGVWTAEWIVRGAVE